MDFFPYAPMRACFGNDPGLIQLSAVADGLTALAWILIPILLLGCMRRAREFLGDQMPPEVLWALRLFSALFLLGAMTRVMIVLTIWWPLYWESATIKFLGAGVALYAAWHTATIIDAIARVARIAKVVDGTAE